MNTNKYSDKQSEALQYGVEIFKALELPWGTEGLTFRREVNAFEHEYLAAKTELSDLPESVFNELLTKGIELAAKLATLERIHNKGACWCSCFRRFCAGKMNKRSGRNWSGWLLRLRRLLKPPAAPANHPSGQTRVTILTEGKVKKGGVKPKPSSPKPSVKPSGQKPRGRSLMSNKDSSFNAGFFFLASCIFLFKYGRILCAKGALSL